ncbi:HD domain-containing phosphohydrolase [Mesoaciditoga lauensis]|uniref:HD domain-containing phosphohydrolase n=1 Tax=Mesoaciditoga lauensis TaxID=1495039 RepID=UPI00068B6AE3|nr:HD domain-containing phosphohydrolase [Mesoaciditoga lauensis]
MKIRAYLLIWFFIILLTSLGAFIWFETENFHLKKNSMISKEAEDYDKNMESVLMNVVEDFSGSLPVYVHKFSSVQNQDSIDNVLKNIRDNYGADWAFVTINGENYIYPFVKTASTVLPSSRPWFISSTSSMFKVVGNEFYSEYLHYPIVMMSVAVQSEGKLEVGGVIFKENRFFSMIASKMNGKNFLIVKDGKIVYPNNLSIKNLAPNAIINLNGSKYLLEFEKYDEMVRRVRINSNTSYDIVFLLPYTLISERLFYSIGTPLITFSIVMVLIFLSFLIAAGRIVNSITALSDIASNMDLKRMSLEVNPRLEQKVKKFKETNKIYSKIVEMFQDIMAHIEELKATNEELEASYEDIENLSNGLAVESTRLRELSESSKLIALSSDTNEAASILLDKIINMYNCEGAVLLDIRGENAKIVRSQGKRFEIPSLGPIKDKLRNGSSTTVSKNKKSYYITPILFGSNPIAVLVMMFERTMPREEELEYIADFSTHFAAVLNSNRMIEELRNSYIYLAEKFAEISEIYDYETGSHIHRVGKYSELIAKELGMSDTFIEQIGIYAMIHDIGKLKVPREILMKNGPLTFEEFEEMKKHTLYGEMILGDAPFLEMARHIARSHHEKYDGSGYPDGLKGNEIPIEARIVAISDVYDALRSKRRYKPALTHEKAVEIITKGDGRTLPQHFDPDVLMIFEKRHHEFARIYETFNG